MTTIAPRTGTGSSADVLERVKKLIPHRWFKWVAPYRDAIMGGLSDGAAWCYGLVQYVKAQTRLATAYGMWLDVFAYDFLRTFLTRSGLTDDVFRAAIRATILQERVTRPGMINALTTLTGIAPKVFEPWNTFDTGGYSQGAVFDCTNSYRLKSPKGTQYGSMGYGVGQGGWGNMGLPAQAFIRVWRGASSGVPGVDGYGSPAGGYGVGAIEYVGPGTSLQGITNAIINQLISMTKPTGSIMWTNVGGPVVGSAGYGMPRRPAIFNSKNDSMNLAIL